MVFEVLAVLERAGCSVGAGCALGAGKGVICCWGGIGSNEFSRCSVLCYLGAEFNYNYSLRCFVGREIIGPEIVQCGHWLQR